jgi:hypothetical protein
MKLQKNKEEKSQVLGASMAKEFSIDTSNQMIVSILRDKLYANKIAAVCREVASNSRDANREAGRADVPVVITITEPNSLLSNEGLQISFKDSGIGISPERIENVFLKYGSSTKRSTNNQTGGFGIGAKTPFAYSKEFLVSTVSEHEGKLMKHIYQAIILNNDGVESSQLILVSDEVTDEPTGTEIIVPIDRNDRDDFEYECIKATTLWEVKPELVGFVTRHCKIKNLKKGTDWKLIEGNYSRDMFGTLPFMFFLEVDGIPYKMKLDEIPNSNPNRDLLQGKIYNMSERYYYGDCINLVLKFNTGELTLSASREDVETTNDNVSLIAKKYEKMLEELKAEGIAQYSKLTTDIDKISLYNNIRNASGSTSLDKFYNKFNLASELASEFVELKTLPKNYFDFANKTCSFYSFGVNDTYSTAKKNINNDVLIRKNIMSNVLFVFRKPEERSNWRKNITLREKAEELGKGEITMIIEKIGVKTFLTTEAVKSMKKMLDDAGLSYVNYEDVEAAKVTRPKGERKPVDKVRGTISARLVKNRTQYHGGYRDIETDKISLKYFKETKEMEFESYFSEGVNKSKMVIVPLTMYHDLKDVDLVNIYWRCLNRSENKTSIGDADQNYHFVLKLLMQYDYNLIIVSDAKYKLVEKTKCLLGLKEAFEKLTKSKKFITHASELKNISDIEDYESVSEDYEYNDLYIKNTVGKNYLKLVGFNVDDYTVYGSDNTKDKVKEENHLAGFKDVWKWRDTTNELIAKYGLDNKSSRFDNMISETMIDEQLEKIKMQFPLFHLMFEEIVNSSGWSLRKYDKNESEEKAKEKMTKLFSELLNSELEKMNIKPSTKKRGRPRGSKNKK